MECLYEPGKHYIDGFIIGEKTQYSCQAIGAYLMENPKTEIWDFDKAVTAIRKAEIDNFVTDWKEITEDEWMEMLEVLPPEKWHSGPGWEMFRMMEYWSGNITAHYARVGTRYFMATKEIGNYTPMIKKIRESMPKMGEEFKLKKFLNGQYKFQTPPVCTTNWNDESWINYIDKSGVWL